MCGELVGSEAYKQGEYTYPNGNGHVDNWDDMVKLWDHAFKSLEVDPSQLKGVLVAEKQDLNPLDKIIEIFFERFNV